jgi:hypothetical protein
MGWALDYIRLRLYRGLLSQLRRLLKGHGPVDGYALKREGKSWIVFYAERGNRSEIVKSSTEDLACRELLRRLTGSMPG